MRGRKSSLEPIQSSKLTLSPAQGLQMALGDAAHVEDEDAKLLEAYFNVESDVASRSGSDFLFEALRGGDDDSRKGEDSVEDGGLHDDRRNFQKII